MCQFYKFDTMELKKNPEVDGDKIKSSFMMIALNYVAGLSLAAFTFQSVKIEDDLSDSKSRLFNIQSRQSAKSTATVGTQILPQDESNFSEDMKYMNRAIAIYKNT